MSDIGIKVLSAAICMGIGSVGPALAEGMVASKAMEAMGRNPSIAESISPKMITAMAICESTGIYALVVSLIILFVA
jgi:F-type H+-transporting ATPase subunit c